MQRSATFSCIKKLNFLLVVSVLTSACNDDGSTNPAKTEFRSEPHLYQISEKEIERLKEAARLGDEEAALRASELAQLHDSESNFQEAITILEPAIEAGSVRATLRKFDLYLSRGQCENAAASVAALQKTEGSTVFSDVEKALNECYQRPIGDGSWTTRRVDK